MSFYDISRNLVFSDKTFLLLGRFYLNLSHLSSVWAEAFRDSNEDKIYCMGIYDGEYFNEMALRYFQMAGANEDAAYLEDMIQKKNRELRRFFGSNMCLECAFGSEELIERMPNPKYGVERMMMDVVYSFSSVADRIKKLISTEKAICGVRIDQPQWMDHPL